MDRIDFSDINRFFTSLGLILIAIGILLPWYVHLNLEILLIEQSDLENITSGAKLTVLRQQCYISCVSKFLPLIMVLLILGGALLIYIGLKNWKKRQVVINGIQDEEWRIKKLQGITSEDKKAALSNEVDASEPDKSKAVTHYLQIEENIFTKLALLYNANYVVEQNRKLQGFEYDIILRSKYFNKRPDLILEIKYYKSAPQKSTLHSIVRRLVSAISHYEQALERPRVTPILILIASNNDIVTTLRQYDRTNKELALGLGMNNLRIIYMLENDIEAAVPQRFIEENRP